METMKSLVSLHITFFATIEKFQEGHMKLWNEKTNMKIELNEMFESSCSDGRMGASGKRVGLFSTIVERRGPRNSE